MLLTLPLMGHLPSFGLNGCVKETSQEVKLTPFGQNHVMPGIARNDPSGNFEVLKARTQRSADGRNKYVVARKHHSFPRSIKERRWNRPNVATGIECIIRQILSRLR